MNKKVVIVLVEDEPLQEKRITGAIEGAIPNCKVIPVSTEHQFRTDIERLVSLCPIAFVVDDMLRWSFPAENAPPVPLELQGQFYCAGLRCIDLITADPRLAGVPIILYTVLDEVDIEEELAGRPLQVIYVRKESETATLIEHLLETTATKRSN